MPKRKDGTEASSGSSDDEVERLIDEAQLLTSKLLRASAGGQVGGPIRKRAAAVAARLLAAAELPCSLSSPPAEIDRLIDPDDNHLIYCCRHTPPHRWTLDGAPKK
ncbi:MAG: hypothetical protein JNK67_21385 [Alphaproteobacteria bacterium]|nr:hypothetical protein [Alphaproteobacteria bacterium]